ncbi:MAG: UPF0755 protein [Parcubacteria group bacterium Licking1014_17]|nr:MAG: UPF0755 protein [Parcubacteria group bacterium Licking1014_17]
MKLVSRTTLAATGLITGVILIAAINVAVPWKTPLSNNFIINKGETMSSIASRLKEDGIISNTGLFVFFARISGHDRDFKAGKYSIPQHISAYKLVRMFSEGKGLPNDIVVMIPEGSNVGDIDKFLSDNGVLQPGEFLAQEVVSREGNFFPDSYRFVPDTSPREIAERLYNAFGEKTSELLGGLSDQEKERIIIVASILEKEVRSTQEMRLVAGVIENRLKKGMPLALDATVAYGACRPIFLNHKYCDVSEVSIVDNLKKDSAYNTYMRKGLIPGPISSPGLRAISAALHPQPSSYYYYLTTRDGVTMFSKTASEHLMLREKYLK